MKGINDMVNLTAEQKIELINKQMNDASKNLINNMSKKIEESKSEIKKRILEKKMIMQSYPFKRVVPRFIIIKNSDEVQNFIIDEILFCLANLETIAEFCFEQGNDKQQFLMKFQGLNNFLICFMKLMTEMRDLKDNIVGSISIGPIHSQLKIFLNNYISQDPGFLISKILEKLNEDINLPGNNGNNKYRNLIDKNFSVSLKTKKTCSRCNYSLDILNEKKYVIDLFLKKPENYVNFQEELKSIFKSLLISGRRNIQERKCVSCGQIMNDEKSIENLKKYLIININREEDPENNMKIDYNNPFILFDEKENKKYELILALVDLKTNTNQLNENEIININESNKMTFKIYFKNFINGKNYVFSYENKETEIPENLHQAIKGCNPNLLIFKRIN